MGSIVPHTKVDKRTGKTITRHRALIRRVGFESKSKVCDTLREAREWLRVNESDDQLERSGVGTFAALVETFVAAPPTNGTKTWAPVHLEFWVSQLGDLRPPKIGHSDINAAKAVLRASPAWLGGSAGRKIMPRLRSDATINRYGASLSSVFNFALDNGIIDAHPMKGGRVKKLAEGGGRRRILTADEEARLMAAAEQSRWPMLPLFLRMLMTTAARKGELQNLKWSDVHLDQKVAILNETKNGSSRSMPLVADVRAALVEARRVRPLHSDFVFFNPRHPERPFDVETPWLACRKAAGLEGDRADKLDQVVMHSTRHTTVTRLLRGGANLAQTQAISGHKTLSMLQRYTHLAASDSVDLAERLLG